MHIKYPRTMHLPWSEGATSDDKILANVEHFQGKQVIVTEKMDGENTTMYSDHIHARSLDSKDHWSRHTIKAMWAGIRHHIPDGYRICGENLYATHSIEYTDLTDHFMAFSMWTDENLCMSWPDAIEFLGMLGIRTVPVLWEGEFDEDAIRYLWLRFHDQAKEGYVVRLAGEFHFNNFATSVAKFVRANHVQTDEHWMHSKDRKTNGLKGENHEP